MEIHRATIDDIPDIAAIHVVGWQESYGGLIDQDYLDSMTVQKRTDDWTGWMNDPDNTTTSLVAVQDNKIVGFIAFGPLRTAPPGTSKIRPLYSSEIYALYLLPEFIRQGIGTALIQDAVKHLKEQKHKSMCLWVLHGNKRACGFYDAMGGQRVGKKQVEFGRTKAKEVCYGWRDMTGMVTS